MIYLPAEIAAYLRISVRTLQSWRHRGGGPPFRKYGELVRYKGSAVLEWDESRSRRTTSDTPLRVVRQEGRRCSDGLRMTSCRETDAKAGRP